MINERRPGCRKLLFFSHLSFYTDSRSFFPSLATRLEFTVKRSRRGIFTVEIIKVITEQISKSNPVSNYQFVTEMM